MKKIHIFAPQNHSNQFICDVGKMASHSFVTRHCEAVQRHDHSNIEYIYAADGTKLRTIHRPASSSALTDSIDYIGNLILKNGQPSMYIFDGGYVSFGTNGAVNGWHYYIQDYMGNNRMVVNKNGTTEQVTHYYPYGGVIGDISTNESVQKYKFEGNELDRTFGLDNYDIHARQYFAMMPSWDRIDPFAEKYYGISPYVYCGGDPVNFGDYDGMDRYALTYDGYLVGPENDGSKTITLYRQGKANVPTYQVPQSLESVILNMAESKTNTGKITAKNRVFLNGYSAHFSVTTSSDVYYLHSWIVSSTLSDEGAEWRVDSYSTSSGMKYLIGTQHKSQFVDEMDGLTQSVDLKDKTSNMHNHLIGGTEGPSNADGKGDMKECEKNPNILYFVAVPQRDGTINYYLYGPNNPGTKYTLEEIINTINNNGK